MLEAKGVGSVRPDCGWESTPLRRGARCRLSERIIQFREANGPFQRVDELVAVKGIGERSLEKLRPYLAVDGDTTLSDKVHLPRAAKATDSAS